MNLLTKEEIEKNLEFKLSYVSRENFTFEEEGIRKRETLNSTNCPLRSSASNDQNNSFIEVWFNPEGLTLRGVSSYDVDSSYISVEVDIWKNPDNWGQTIVPLDILQYATIRLYVESKYPDLNDLDEPIKPYFQTLGSWSLNPFKSLIIKPTIERHELDLEDSIFTYFSNDDPLVFNKVWEEESVTFESHEFLNRGSIYEIPATIDISLGANVYQYKRKVLTIFEVTGFLGGVFEIFEIIFGFILGTISSYTFKRQILVELKESRDQYFELKTQLAELQQDKASLHNSPNLTPRDWSEDNKSNIEENKIIEEEKVLERFNEHQYNGERNIAAFEDLQRFGSQDKSLGTSCKFDLVRRESRRINQVFNAFNRPIMYEMSNNHEFKQRESN